MFQVWRTRSKANPWGVFGPTERGKYGGGTVSESKAVPELASIFNILDTLADNRATLSGVAKLCLTSIGCFPKSKVNPTRWVSHET